MAQFISGTEIAVAKGSWYVFKDIASLTQEDEIRMFNEYGSMDDKQLMRLDEKDKINHHDKVVYYKLSNGYYPSENDFVTIYEEERKISSNIKASDLMKIIYNTPGTEWKLMSKTYGSPKFTFEPLKIKDAWTYEGTTHTINSEEKVYVLCRHNGDQFIVLL